MTAPNFIIYGYIKIKFLEPRQKFCVTSWVYIKGMTLNFPFLPVLVTHFDFPHILFQNIE